MSQTLIIYAHPYEGSFNHAILEEVKAGLEASGRPYEVIDLYADGFDPCGEATSPPSSRASSTRS